MVSSTQSTPSQICQKLTDNNEVAVDRTHPNGKVLGIDIIPAQPPKGVSTIQGNFLSPTVQYEVKSFLEQSCRVNTRKRVDSDTVHDQERSGEEDPVHGARSFVELGRKIIGGKTYGGSPFEDRVQEDESHEDGLESGLVDVMLSDMSEPWAQTEGFWKRSLSDPYYRMMNTSGVSFRDHAGSMV